MATNLVHQTGKSIKFKPATFYLRVVDNLAGKVEGQPELGNEEAAKKSEPTESKADGPTDNQSA